MCSQEGEQGRPAEYIVHFIEGTPLALQARHVAFVLVLVLASTVLVLSRRGRWAAGKLVRLGFFFHVASSLLISVAVTDHFHLFYEGREGPRGWGISWLCVWIIMFPLVT